MLNLGKFVSSIDEGRRPKEVINVVDAEDVDVKDIKKVAQGGKEVPASKALNVKKGQSAEDNGTNGIWAIEPPTQEEIDGNPYTVVNKSKMTKNQRMLANRMKSEANFLAIGEAGWGKTAEITKVAHAYGYTIITVYLDKAVASDLGGIPVPAEDSKTGQMYANYTMPGWALVMLQNPDTKYLLFFDEMNQAADDVQNALMPIVEKKVICGHEFHNYICGAAGNHSFENESVNALSKPLEKRFMPFEWECRTPSTWASHFEWAHKNFDSKIGPEVIDKCAELQQYWDSPRDITKKIYQWCEKNQNGTMLDTEDLMSEIISGAVWSEVDQTNRKFKEDMQKFAEYLINWSDNGGAVEQKRSRSKGQDNIDKDEKEAIKSALQRGYFFYEGEDDKAETYLVSVENCVRDLFNPEITGITAEILNKIVREMEAAGTPPRYYTNKDGEADAKKNGWIIL